MEISYEENQDESIVLDERDPDEFVLNDHTRVDIDDEKIFNDDESNMDENSLVIDKTESTRFFKIKLKPNRKYNFELRFSPQKPKIYSFYFPITLAGYGRIESLTRRVLCKGITPKFLMEPLNGVIEFKKKVITSQDSVMPEFRYISISNPDVRNPLNWKLDISALDEDKVFTIIPINGTIDPQSTITLKTGFRPLSQNSYEAILPLKLESEEKPYCEITLKGEGAYPRILFDRSEVI